MYDQVLELINPQPGFKLLDVTSHCDGLTQAIAKHLEPFDAARLAVSQYPGEHQELMCDIDLKIHEVPNYKAPFRALPRDNDMVFIRDVLDRHEFPERLIKAVYTTLANTGDIVIISSKPDQIEQQLELLERLEFRAGNAIDIWDNISIVTAKKMHMWGNGL